MVTAMGCLNSFGYGVERTWSALRQGHSAIAPITRFDVTDFRTKVAAEISEEQMSLLPHEHDVVHLSRNAQFSVAVAAELIRAQHWDHEWPRSAIGICLGSGLGGMYFSEEALAALQRTGPRGVSPLTVPYVDPNAIVSRVAAMWGLTGPQLTVSTACSSSAHAIGTAMDMIRSGRCDAVLTGGVEATMSPLIYSGFDRLRAMSTRNAMPDTACRPFSDDRDGFVMAEGAAMFLLEEASCALSRGARIYAELMGYGASGGAYHQVAPLPDGSDLVMAMRKAMEDANIQPHEVDLINPHGTGTRLNDEAELRALRIVFQQALDEIFLTPTKQLTGHLLGASGALESLHVIKSIQESIITPIRYADSSSNLNIVQGGCVSNDVRIAMNNSFGFGNNNVSLIFGVYR